MPERSSEITFVVFTFNEEKRIELAIRNFMQYGPILIVDNESSDRTCGIASQYGCDVLINKNAGWVEDEITAARVKSAVKTPWIYWGFADEMVEAHTLAAILRLVHSRQYDIVNIVRKNYYYGEFCYDLFASRMNRIFRKEAIDFTGNKIHCFGKVVAGARVHAMELEYFVHHFISNTAKTYLQVMDRYTDTERLEDRPVPSIFRLILSTGKTVLLGGLFRRGARSTLPGGFLIAQMAYYRWLSTMKLYEKQMDLDPVTIEMKNNAVRDRILRSFA